MIHVIRWVKGEIIKVIPAVIYFCVAFNLIFFISGLPLHPGDVRYFNYFTVTITALIMGKVLIIVNAFPWINAFPRKPMIYNIVWKFFIYSIVIFLVEALDAFISLWLKYKSLEVAYYSLGIELQSPIFWSVILCLLMVFLIFIVFSEFVQVLGKAQIKKMMIG